MRTARLACVAAALGAGFAAHAADRLLSRQEIKAHQARIEEQYGQAQMRCRRVQGHARGLCNEEARQERHIQSAELRLRADPSAENDLRLRLAKAESAYALALVRCKALDGPARTICLRDAQDTLAAAKGEAKLQNEVAAQAMRSEQDVRAHTSKAKREAEAEYGAARRRCEALPPQGRANCLADAQRRFGRS